MKQNEDERFKNILKSLETNDLEKSDLESIAIEISLDHKRASVFDKIITHLAKLEGVGKLAKKREIQARAREQKIRNLPEYIGDYVLPDGYYLDKGLLHRETKDGYQIVCEYFIVNEIHQTSDKKETVFSLLFPQKNKIVAIDVEEFVDNKKLEAKLINYDVYIGENISKFKNYINSFVNINDGNIKKTILTSSTGWQIIDILRRGEDGKIRTVKEKRYCNPIIEQSIEYVEEIEKKIYKMGSVADAIEILNVGLKYRGSALSILSSLSASLVYPLRNSGLSNYIINFAGTTGMGKTLSARIGLSMYGNAQEGAESLSSNMNSTAVGNEIKFNTFRDMPTLLDEAGTAKGSAEIKARAVLDTIFQYFSGQGRTRATKTLKMQEERESRGVLLMTMEYDLKTIEKMAKTQEKGYFRRTIEVFTDTKDFLPMKEIYDFGTINMTFGHIAQAFIGTIGEGEQYQEIKKDYERIEKELSRPELRGKEKYFAVLHATLEHLLRIGIINEKSYLKARYHLDKVFEENIEIMQEITTKANTKWVEMLIEFISINQSNFEEAGSGRIVMGRKFGNIAENKKGEMEIIIYPSVLSDFLVNAGINDRAFKKELYELGILKVENSASGSVKYEIKRLGARCIVLNKEKLYETLEEEEREEQFEAIEKIINATKEIITVAEIDGELYDLRSKNIVNKLNEGLAKSKNKKKFVADLERQTNIFAIEIDGEEPTKILKIPF